MRRLLALALLLLLLPGLAAAAPPSRVAVELVASGGAWNGETLAETDAASVALWVPPGARIHGVFAGNASAMAPVSWQAEGREAVRASVPQGATFASVRYDFVDGRPVLATVALPEGAVALDLLVRPADGLVPTSDAAAFREEDGEYRARLSAVAPGARIPLRVIDEGRVGEVPVLVAVGVVSLAALALGIAWHKARPPNEGREPTKFLDHLAEMQARLLPPVAVFGALNLVYFTMGLRTRERGGFDVLEPVFGVDASLSSRAFEAFAERLVPDGVQLVVTRPADAVLAQIEMALFLAFLSTLPLLLYELAAFLGPALLPKEQRVALRALPLVAGLFVGGALFGLVVMAPFMIETLYGYAPALGAAPLLVVQELVSFALLVLLVFGFAFELPVVMYVLARLGIVAAATFRRYWRHAVVAIVLLAGFLTPDPSVVSQALVAAPLLVLYAVGAVAAGWGERARA